MISPFEILQDGIFGAIAGIGFGAISHPPFRAFKGIALLSGIAHATRFVLMHYMNLDIATASLFAAIVSGFLSIPMGEWTKCPLTVLYIPSLLPMIPGKFAYNSVFGLIMFMEHSKSPELQTQYMDAFLSNGVVAITTIFLLAVGSTLPRLLFPNTVNSVTRKNIPETVQK